MLEVRCGVADRSHENRFFRYFASEVKNVFERRGIDGILLGMPNCKVRDNLQIDALLVTDSSITIIDFKDYDDCTVELPGESDFDRGRWETDRGMRVKGGSSPNPFTQLRLQRSRLREILKMFCRHKMAEFDVGHITSMVCFTGKVIVKGSVPGRFKLTFCIADSDDFLERLYDIVNVRSSGLLESPFAKNMLSELFEAPAYECELRPEKPVPEPEEEPEPEPQVENTVADEVKAFLEGDSDILLIRSQDPAKRMEVARFSRELCHDSGFTETRVLSSTKLAGDNLCFGIDPDGSLYSEVYDRGAKWHDDEFDVDRIPVATAPSALSMQLEGESPASDEEPGDGSVRLAFVICEGHLVSDNAWTTGNAIFGSGRLLSDTLQYLSVDGQNSGTNKIIVIGDDCQLGANPQASSSLHKDAYPPDLSVREIDVPAVEPEREVDALCHRLASCMHQSRFNLMSLEGNDEDMEIINEPADERADIEHAVSNWRSHKIVTDTNAQASRLNSFIKRSVKRNGESLAPGDVLLFGEQFNAVSTDPFAEAMPVVPVRNGDFAEVLRVDGADLCLNAKGTGGGESVTLARIGFRLEGSQSELEAYVVLEHLTADRAELTAGQVQAIKAKMAEIERSYLKEHPFTETGNPFFNEMLREGGFQQVEDANGIVGYRDASDRRKLTSHEKKYRNWAKGVLCVPGSLYFGLRNIAKARYGWALTAYKARSYYWSRVTLSANSDTGRNTDAYYRYLYTGASRAMDKLVIVRWKDIQPFGRAEFVSEPSNVRKKAKRQVLFRASSAEGLRSELEEEINRRLPDSASFSHLSSSAWREAFRFEDDVAEAVVAFDYNKKNEVLAPRLEKGDRELFLRVSASLEGARSAETGDSPLSDAYGYLRSLEEGTITVDVNKSMPHQDEVVVETGGAAFSAVVHHNAGGIVSRVEFQHGDREAFDHVRRLLQDDDAAGR